MSKKFYKYICYSFPLHQNQMSESSHDTRIAVLEKIAESHDKRISDMEDFHRDVVDRLDQKIQSDTTNQITMERTLAKAVTALDSLNETVRHVSTIAESANKIAIRHESAVSASLKIGSFLAIIGSAVWSLFVYFAK